MQKIKEMTSRAPQLTLTVNEERSDKSTQRFCISKHRRAIWWARNDLRLIDNPAFEAAQKNGCTAVIYILSDQDDHPWPLGGAAKWWLHHSLAKLRVSLEKKGIPLLFFEAPYLTTLQNVIKTHQITHVFWNRRYEPHARTIDANIKQQLRDQGCTVESFSASLIYEPWEILNQNQKPYQVFTPYWKAWSARLFSELKTKLKEVISHDSANEFITEQNTQCVNPDHCPRWAAEFHQHWEPGESGAQKNLAHFMGQVILKYASQRDLPSQASTSRLSPHLRFGEIGPRQILNTIYQHKISLQHSFVRELAWREFSHYLLFHFPQITTQSLKPKFNHFPWRDGEEAEQDLRAWQKGKTGFAIVDAGMSELWRTGWMHNRVRMMVASFLVKDLLIPWQKGAAWFWETLVDADLAQNSQGWQWSAGTGVDAAPFFRIFNPDLQQEKYDPEKKYVQKWLGNQNSSLKPIVDHKRARNRALAAYDKLK